MKTVFLLLTLCLTAMAEQTGSVAFWSDEVSMTCPHEHPIWNEDGNIGDTIKTVKYKEINGIQTCKSDEEKYYFYIKGYVCPNCYELDGSLVIGLILGDLLVTGGIVILIYHWAQKKSGSSPASAVARPGPRGGQRGPAVPNRDYEVLNPRTRDATYAVAGVNRTG